MKKLKFINLIVLILFISSCSQDELTIDEFSLDKTEEKAIINLLESNLSIQVKSKVEIVSTELKKINDSYYLVSKHSDYVTTTLLKANTNKTLGYAGISCTSKSCSNNDGCIPHKNGKKCTECKGWNPDCTKTVTSELSESF